MYTGPQKRTAGDTLGLRREAGRWLRDRREARGLSQRELAERVGAEYYTFISQIETGRGRIPTVKYKLWSAALGLGAREFVLALLPFCDPPTYDIALFESPDGGRAAK